MQRGKPRSKLLSFPSPSQTWELMELEPQLKTHVYAVSILSAACLLVWVFIQFFIGTFPWFLIPLSLGFLSTSYHFFMILREKQDTGYFQLHLVWSIVLSVTFFIFWLFYWRSSRYTWFIYPFIFFFTTLSLHYQWERHRGIGATIWFRLHTIVFLGVNLFMLFLWMENKQRFPWFIIPLFISIGFFLIHFCFAYYPNNAFVLHLTFFGYSNTLLFVIWILQEDMYFPWFIFPLIVGVALIIVHHNLARKNSSYAEINSSWASNISPPISDLEHNPPPFPHPNQNAFHPSNEQHSVIPDHMRSNEITPHPPVYQNPYGGYQNSEVPPVISQPDQYHQVETNSQGYTPLE